jgi:phosphomethylpyrimidine synthase
LGKGKAATTIRRGVRADCRDNAISKTRFEFRWEDQFNLSLDPDVRKYAAPQGISENKAFERRSSLWSTSSCELQAGHKQRLMS